MPDIPLHRFDDEGVRSLQGIGVTRLDPSSRMTEYTTLRSARTISRRRSPMSAPLPVLGSVGSFLLGGVLGFVLWVVILVWIYNIAERKGRHPIGWLVLGFFFSLLALVVLLLLPSKRTTRMA
jgi:hypothetical protein